ncbi:tRNA-dihydrouridine synthase 4-like protein [Atta colombica]|uniref:tRNA-dihydrouridine(20a/20b) synthase [NAD(P)+] n=1 Tax=Atta colombica TaxID=520822 RepID=A0A195BC07_9HYME|nr:PREDICTED: gamma-glutamyltransferase 7 [Atta colombica]KYM81752.1 tRNA-dihydrouridine synthase 4-like protein [Atta colombica]
MTTDVMVTLKEPRMIKICAPMVRYSKLQFRTLVRRYGCDICFTPMILADSFVQSSKARDNEFTTHEGDEPLIVQFAAKTVNDFVGASVMVAPYCNGVDLNCGCPQRWAMQEGYGANLLKKPELIKDLVYQVRNHIPKPFTVSAKIRLLKDIRKTITLCQTLEKAGASFLTIHARTPEMRNEPIDLDNLKLLRDCIQLPLIANGDVKSLENAEFLFKESRCEGVMSARGILTNPALFSGYPVTPLVCVQDWLNITSTMSTEFQCFHHHLVFILCGNGLKVIVVCFIALTFAITTMLMLQILYTKSIPQSSLHSIHGAVATDYSNCSQIGTKILTRLGNAVDAAVAATICMAVVAPHKTGFGGGGYIIIYNYKNYTHPIVIDFASNTTTGFFAEVGIRLPAVLKGLEFAQRAYGNLPWRNVIEPTIELAREGFVISKDLADEVSKTDYEIFSTGPLNPGDRLQLQELTKMLDIVAHYGAQALYNSTENYEILQNTTLNDKLLQQLADYEPTVTMAESSILHRHTIYYPVHASFMQEVIKALENLSILAENASTIESQALVAQTLMSVSLQSSQSLQYEEKRETYTGVMAMDWQDTYVSILTGLSSPFGHGNKMDGFPFFLDNIDNDDLSMFIPIIFHHNEKLCGLRGVLGSNDVFLNGQILYNLIVRALNVSAAIEYPRYYFAADGMVIENNQRHSMEVALQAQLDSIISSLSHDDISSIRSVNAIVKRKDSLSSHSDSRGNGIASRF